MKNIPVSDLHHEFSLVLDEGLGGVSTLCMYCET